MSSQAENNTVDLEITEYQTTEVRLRRALPESKLSSPGADPHVLRVVQPTAGASSSHATGQANVSGDDIIEYSKQSIEVGPGGSYYLRSGEDSSLYKTTPEKNENPDISVQQTDTLREEEDRESNVMLLQTPEQLQTYHRLLIVKDHGVVAVGEPTNLNAAEGEARTTSPAPSNASAAMSFSVVSVTEDGGTEYKELNNSTLRRYYGDVTPYGTVAKVHQPDANVSQTVEYLPGDGSTTLPRGISPLRATSPTGSASPTGRYGTILRRERGGFYTRTAERIEGSLNYIDFMPRRIKSMQSFNLSRSFEKFQNCMDEANKFLEQNPNVEVRNCESLYQRLDHSHRINPESTTSHDRSYVIGLRLWYTVEGKDGDVVIANNNSTLEMTEETTSTCVSSSKEDGQDATTGRVQEKRRKLCYRNIIPEYKEKTRPKDKPRKHRDCPQFESIKYTVDKLNESLAGKPIPGQLVNVETIPINYSYAFREGGILDPDVGYWCLDFLGHWNLFIVRLFYIEGQTMDNYEIGFEDFAPAPTKITPSCPEFQGFQALSANASRWLSSDANRDISVIGAQAIEIPFRLKRLVAHKGKIDTHRSFYEPSKISAYWNTLRILRVWYTRTRRESGEPSTSRLGSSRSHNVNTLRRGLGSGPGIALRTFTPCQVTTSGCCGLRKPMFATTHDTILRINEWIALTGAEVIAIQTDNVEKWRGKRCELGRSLEDRTYNKQDFPSSVATSSLEYRLTVFRVFVRSDSRGGHPEPDGKDFPECPVPVEPCCCFVGCSVM